MVNTLVGRYNFLPLEGARPDVSSAAKKTVFIQASYENDRDRAVSLFYLIKPFCSD